MAREWQAARSRAALEINAPVRNQSHRGLAAQDPAMVSQTITSSITMKEIKVQGGWMKAWIEE